MIKSKEWLSKGGYHDLSREFKHPGNIHSENFNLSEAVESEPAKPAKERVKENVTIIGQDIKKTLSKEKQELEQKYYASKHKLKESISDTKNEIETSFTETEKRIKKKYKEIQKE